MAIASNLGFPRIGVQRELKKAVESYWKAEIPREDLETAAAGLRLRHWKLQQQAGIEHIPSGDFSLYDHVLDMIAMVGAVPERYGWTDATVDLSTYFAMARGTADVPAMEMTKWFDTNYHYIVPELEHGMKFRLSSTKPVDQYKEALAHGIRTRPVLLGPITFLLLGKGKAAAVNPLSLLDSLVAVYEEVLRKLGEAGAEWVQIDEPVLALDLDEDERAALPAVYERLRAAAPGVKICLATYFGDLQSNLEPTLELPVAAVHLDLVRAPAQLERALAALPEGRMLSLGVIDGRNVWRADLDRAILLVEKAKAKIGGDRLHVGPSCSLLHSPIDLERETELDQELRDWMAFAAQKLAEIATVARAVNEGTEAVAQSLAAARQALATRRQSPRIHNPEVKKRLAAIEPAMLRRRSPFAERRQKQHDSLKLPKLPTTTIGSFPQTAEVRKARAAFKKGEWTAEQYQQFCKLQIAKAVEVQEELDIDVLVHGEFERNDMVEYFGEQLDGFAFTSNGWVQSYGSRCVKPPVIFGDVSRPRPMTVEWSRYAQSLTKRPMKGMLTGPITILKWSFVRDDQPLKDTAFQIALAIRDEVRDLEAAGIRVIQIDEPALREGLPLHRAEWAGYLKWAVDAFRLAAGGVADETQIHTHMCYAEFNHIIQAIADLDADVISIEASRSDMDLLEAFVQFKYPNEIGPGVYDIHSPRVPDREEMVGRLKKALRAIKSEQLWVNPDCGLKTRGWPETTAALEMMVGAAKSLRSEV
ncbi:MAG: 5-methyltetrahydropteroyltriglutamate--homocysteine S-methyltransferase [Planctomycetota bacterium]